MVSLRGFLFSAHGTFSLLVWYVASTLFSRGKVFSSSIQYISLKLRRLPMFYVFNYLVNVSFHSALPSYEGFGPYVSLVTIPAASVSFC